MGMWECMILLSVLLCIIWTFLYYKVFCWSFFFLLFLNHCEYIVPIVNKSFTPTSLELFQWSVPNAGPSTSVPHDLPAGGCYWSQVDIGRKWDPKKQATWPRTQDNEDGGRTATPWRCLLHILFGAFLSIIVREHVCFIVTCSILVHPVFLEKWISQPLSVYPR